MSMISLSFEKAPVARLYSAGDTRFVLVEAGGLSLSFEGAGDRHIRNVREFALAILTALANEPLPAFTPAPIDVPAAASDGDEVLL